MDGLRRHRQLNGGRPLGWSEVLSHKTLCVASVPNPITLYAVVSTWCDADIIKATVDNCFNLGCARVYILDNDSPDNTVSVGLEAGAILGNKYTTDLYDDDYRCVLQNDIMRQVTTDEQLPTLWWLALDADEFPVLTTQNLSEYLSILPEYINTIGAYFIDLYPTAPDQYLIGEHPASCMQMGVWRRGGTNRYCASSHWKHQLIKYTNGVWDMCMSRGNHAPGVPDRTRKVLEPETSLVTFHAPLRREEDARNRLRLLCANGRSSWDDQVTGNNGAIKRWTSLDAIYNQHWQEVEVPHTQMYGRPVQGLALYPWRKLVPELAEVFNAR